VLAHLIRYSTARIYLKKKRACPPKKIFHSTNLLKKRGCPPERDIPQHEFTLKNRACPPEKNIP